MGYTCMYRYEFVHIYMHAACIHADIYIYVYIYIYTYAHSLCLQEELLLRCIIYIYMLREYAEL